MSNRTRSALTPLLAVAAVMLACSDSGSGASSASPPTPDSPSSQSTATEAEQSLGYKLAVIDDGGFVREDAAEVRRFESLLSSLDTKYPEGEQEIADMSVKAKQLLNSEGISESMLNIMEGMNRVGNSNGAGSSYGELTAAYLTLRNQSQSHDEAVSGLSSLLTGLGQ